MNSPGRLCDLCNALDCYRVEVDFGVFKYPNIVYRGPLKRFMNECVHFRAFSLHEIVYLNFSEKLIDNKFVNVVTIRVSASY